jgi:hypothetical protein
MNAGSELELVRDRPRRRLPARARLKSLRDEGAVVRADDQILRVGRARLRARQDAIEQRVPGRVGVAQHLGDIRATQPLKARPNPAQVVAVERGDDLDVAPAPKRVRERELRARPFHAVERRRGIATVGVGFEVVLRQPEVRLVAHLAREPELQLELVEEPGVVGGRVARFRHRLAALEARIRAVVAVDRLEAVVREVHALDEHAEVVSARREPRVGLSGEVLADREIDHGVLAVGDARRHEVDRPRHRMRPVDDAARPLHDAHARHARHHGKVVGRRRAVGCRPEQHPILHEGQLLAAIADCAAHADVRAQAEAVFPAHVNAGHGEQDRVRIVVLEALELLRLELVDRAARLRRALSEDAHFLGRRGLFGCAGRGSSLPRGGLLRGGFRGGDGRRRCGLVGGARGPYPPESDGERGERGERLGASEVHRFECKKGGVVVGAGRIHAARARPSSIRARSASGSTSGAAGRPLSDAKARARTRTEAPHCAA